METGKGNKQIHHEGETGGSSHQPGPPRSTWLLTRGSADCSGSQNHTPSVPALPRCPVGSTQPHLSLPAHFPGPVICPTTLCIYSVRKMEKRGKPRLAFCLLCLLPPFLASGMVKGHRSWGLSPLPKIKIGRWRRGASSASGLVGLLDNVNRRETEARRHPTAYR